MLYKAIVLTLHDCMFPWFDKWVENVNTLEKYGWHVLIFTDMPIESKGNITVHQMTLDEYADRIEKKTGVRPSIVARTTKYSDLHPALGYVFSEYLKGYDFWVWSNFDVCFGRLDRFLPDSFLNTLDMFSNDPDSFCGPFTMVRNEERMNTMFMRCPSWKEIFRDPKTRAFDESKELYKVVGDEKVRVEYRYWQGNDTPLEMKPDGTLIDQATGQEVMMNHFRHTKRWPL